MCPCPMSFLREVLGRLQDKLQLVSYVEPSRGSLHLEEEQEGDRRGVQKVLGCGGTSGVQGQRRWQEGAVAGTRR